MKAVKEGGFVAQRGGAGGGTSRAPASIWFISHYRNPPVRGGIQTVCSRKTRPNKMPCTLLLAFSSGFLSRLNGKTSKSLVNIYDKIVRMVPRTQLQHNQCE